MTNVTVGSTPTLLIGPNVPQGNSPAPNRVVYISVLSGGPVWLLFDNDQQSKLTASEGFELANLGAQRFGATCPGDNDGNNAIWAVAASSATVNVQAIVGKKSLP